MFFPQSSAMLTKQSLEVSSKGETVVLRIGNVDVPMHYEHALDIHRWIREEARAIKGMTGRGKTIRSLGILEDASARPKPLLHTPGAAIHVKEPLRQWHRGDVSANGRLVLIKIGSKTISLHFETALKVAHWLRLRAKEARNRAGDVRQWSVIGNLEEVA